MITAVIQLHLPLILRALATNDHLPVMCALVQLGLTTSTSSGSGAAGAMEPEGASDVPNDQPDDCRDLASILDSHNVKSLMASDRCAKLLAKYHHIDIPNKQLLNAIRKARQEILCELASDSLDVDKHSNTALTFLQQLALGLHMFLCVVNARLDGSEIQSESAASLVTLVAEAKTSLYRAISNHHNPIVLLDVDDTASLCRATLGYLKERGNEYNCALFESMRSVGIRDIYLFTAYALRGVLTVADETDPTQSRYVLIHELNKYGFIVRGTIVLDDPIYNQGLGRYYLDRIAHWETAVDENHWLFSDLRGNADFAAACAEETAMQESTTATKGQMFCYLLSHLSEEDKQRGLVFIDDKIVYLNDVKAVHENLPDTPHGGCRPALHLIQCIPSKYWESDTGRGYYTQHLSNICCNPIDENQQRLDQQQLDLAFESESKISIFNLRSIIFRQSRWSVEMQYAANGSPAALLALLVHCHRSTASHGDGSSQLTARLDIFRLAVRLCHLAFAHTSDYNAKDLRGDSDDSAVMSALRKLWSDIHFVMTSQQQLLVKHAVGICTTSHESHHTNTAMAGMPSVYEPIAKLVGDLESQCLKRRVDQHDAFLTWRLALASYRQWEIQQQLGVESESLELSLGNYRELVDESLRYAIARSHIRGYPRLIADIIRAESRRERQGDSNQEISAVVADSAGIATHTLT